MIHRALLLIAACGLASCASRPENVLVPVAANAPGASSVDMIVATTRRPVDDVGELYSGERGSGLTFANIVVSIPPDDVRKIGEVEWPASVPGNPATDFVTSKVSRLDLANARMWLDRHAAVTSKHRVLVFVHGFNNRFGDAVYGFAQFVHDSRAEATPLLFTWPSRGNMFAYGYDRESASISRDALEQVLDILARDPKVGEIDILAHSMGNWLVVETLRQMAIRNNGRIPVKIDDVVLASPDIDVDAFRSEISDMGNPRPQFTLIVSRDDRALALSAWIWGGVARLGAIDPESDPYQTQLSAEHVHVLDLSDHKSVDYFNHNKFAESEEIVREIAQRMEGGETFSNPHEGLADRIVSAAAGELGAAETTLENTESPIP